LNLIRVMPAKGRKMLQKSDITNLSAPIHVIGASVAGAWQALMLAKAGHQVLVHERGEAGMSASAAYWAGGMLAPFCESEMAEPIITRLGLRSIELWKDVLPDTAMNGSLVVAHPRDRNDLDRFARLTGNHERVGPERIAEIEPDLAGRFSDALFFPQEGHVDPRKVLPALHQRLRAHGVPITFGTAPKLDTLDGVVVDCRGLGAQDAAPDLRGVKGEIIMIETPDVALSRPIRLIHPRWSLYVVPRDNNRFFLGATSIESEDARMSVRSALELLTAAYVVHPAFAEARILEIGAGLRPAFPDNLPRIAIDGRRILVNGLYRHGFLIAPALAELTAGYFASGRVDSEVMQCA